MSAYKFKASAINSCQEIFDDNLLATHTTHKDKTVYSLLSGVIKVIYVFSYVELITVYFFTVLFVLSAITCIAFLQKYPKCLHIDAIAFLMERYDARENLEAEGNTLLGIRGILRLFANYTDYV